MATCLLTEGRCGRLGTACPSGKCVARHIRKLQERRWRDKLGLFAAEGEDLVEAATAEPVELLVAGENVEARLLAEVSTAPHPPRVIGIYRREDLPPVEPRPVTLALWRVSDPGNLGALIRAADAFGASVLLSEGCADPTGPKALRASTGSIWRVGLGSFADWKGLRVGLTSGGGTSLPSLDLTREVTFLLGAEREGLPETVERDVDAWIPIGAAESLNVAVAGSIALYEWQRQNT